MQRFLFFVVGMVLTGIAASILRLFTFKDNQAQINEIISDRFGDLSERIDELERAWGDAEFIRKISDQ